ncbi:MAG: T9SS type A sorting domain-containing protein [bacterium]
MLKIRSSSLGYLMVSFILFFSISLSAQTEVKILPADGTAGDEFGYEISTYGNYSIIGSLRDDDKGENSGSAYIYLKSGDTIAQEAKLTASDGVAGATFGKSVSIYGTDVVVGSPWRNIYGTNSGGTYAFRKNGSVWEQTANLFPADGLQADDHFGWSVSIYGNYLVTSSMKDGDLAPYAGAIYFFRKETDNWIQMGKHMANDGDFGDQFGRSVSMYGDYCAVGSPYNLGNGTYCGAVYIFKRYTDAWFQLTKIVPETGESGDDFGLCVSLYDDVLAISANKDDDLGSDAGAVYVYQRSGDSFTFDQKLTYSLGSAGDYFGTRPTVYDDKIIVGAPQSNAKSGTKGFAVVYNKIGDDWVEGLHIQASDGQNNDSFGWATSLAQNYAVIGAKFDDDNGTNSGSAFLYLLDTVPVELAAFTGNVADNCVELNWITETELNNSGFEVQRKFKNDHFKNVAFVKGQGTTSERNNYHFFDRNLSGGQYTYRLKQIDIDGTYEYSQEITFEISKPATYSLSDNFPNPFNPSTNIVFSIPEKTNVKIKVFNLLGVEVKTLVDEFFEAGEHKVVFNAEALSSGVYLYNIKAGNFSETKKMILIR